MWKKCSKMTSWDRKTINKNTQDISLFSQVQNSWIREDCPWLTRSNINLCATGDSRKYIAVQLDCQEKNKPYISYLLWLYLIVVVFFFRLLVFVQWTLVSDSYKEYLEKAWLAFAVVSTIFRIRESMFFSFLAPKLFGFSNDNFVV